MAMRLRVIDGTLVALCAAKTQPEPGDLYLDDAQDHVIRVKIQADWDSEGLLNPTGRLILPHPDARIRMLMEKAEGEALDPEGWLAIEEAHKLRVCRVCREPAAPRERADGTVDAFWYGHGYEYAHDDCLTPEAKRRMHVKIAATGPHRGD